MIIGIDAGNEETKVCGSFGLDRFVSDIGEYRERNLEQRFGPDDMIFEYDGRKGFAGTLARFESEFGGTIRGGTKAHEDAKIRVLLAIHRHSSDNGQHEIIVGQPIGSHTFEEKNKIKEMLIGLHVVSLNGVKKRFLIKRVEVSPEGASAIISDPRNGLVRIIDLGSGTWNFATLFDMKRIDRDSWTESTGMETTKTKNSEAMARKIASLALNKWNRGDVVILSGGGSEAMVEPIREYFPRCELIRPAVRFSDRVQDVQPIFANAVAFYEIGRKIYG